eukprot:6965983-Karenia_brevis.AAC.1
MSIGEWPNPSNRPVFNIHIEQQCQINKHMEEAQSQEVWHNEIRMSPQASSQFDRDDLGHLSSSTNIIITIIIII